LSKIPSPYEKKFITCTTQASHLTTHFVNSTLNSQVYRCYEEGHKNKWWIRSWQQTVLPFILLFKKKLNSALNINMLSHSPVSQDRSACLLTWKQRETAITQMHL
jgi:hypothetical protein